jgi:hypothetical protein
MLGVLGVATRIACRNSLGSAFSSRDTRPVFGPGHLGQHRRVHRGHRGGKMATRDASELHALASRRLSPAPIPPEFLGARWRAAERAPSKVASDYYRFQLLTGCRGVEIQGHELHEYQPIRAGDVDYRAGRCACGTRRTGGITSCCSLGRRFRSRRRNCAG